MRPYLQTLTRQLLAVLFCGALVAAVAHSQPGAMSLEDMLRSEGIGNAVIDPSGRWLVYEQMRPYDQYGDYSFRTYAFGKSGHQIWRYDLHGKAPAELLPGVDPAPHTYLQAFSPDGRHLMVMQYMRGRLSLASYDMVTDRLKTFDAAPAISRSGSHNPVWVSDSEFIYAALPRGEYPLDTSVRVLAGSRLTAAWKHAWRGSIATASEVRTRPEAGLDGPTGSLQLANAENGRSQTLADGLFADLRIAPGGRFLGALQIMPAHPSGADSGADNLKVHRLVVFDLETRSQTSPAPELRVFPYTLAWSPDGSRLLFFGWREDQSPADGRFHIFDRRDNQIAVLEHAGLDLASERERGWVMRPERAAFLGDGIAVFARPSSQTGKAEFRSKDIRQAGLSRADWYLVEAEGPPRNLTVRLEGVSPELLHAGPSAIFILAKSGLYQVSEDAAPARQTPPLTGPIRHIPAGTFSTRAGVIRPDFRGDLIFLAEIRGRPHMLAFDPEQNHLVIREADTDSPGLLIGSVRARTFIYLTSEGAVRSLKRTRPAAGDELVARVNTHLADIKTNSWKSVSYAVEDPRAPSGKRRLQSCLLLPAGRRRGTQAPLIIDVYPGRTPVCDRMGFPSFADPGSPYLWSGAGYGYLILSLPQDLLRRSEGPVAGISDLTHPALDTLIAEKLADPDRLVIHGYSQGAAAALTLAAMTDRFAAVIVRHGFADYFSHYFGGAGIYSAIDGDFIGAEAIRYEAERGSDFGLGTDPFQSPEIFVRTSPVFLAQRISSPVMLIHSDMDAFSIGQFDEMFGALRRSGADARYVRYWGEGHGVSSPANIRDMWSRMLAFLEDHGAGPDRFDASESRDDQALSQPSIP